MKTTWIAAIAVVVVGIFLSSARADMTEGMQQGKPAIASMGPLTFGPEAVLFIADTKSGAIFAVATGDNKEGPADKLLKVEGINQKIAAMLGTSADQIIVNDMVVNPISRNAYIAVSRGRGPDAAPVLVRATTDSKLEVVSLDDVKFSKAELNHVPAAAPAGERRDPRAESITDIAYLNNSIAVAGLSTEEFASTLRAIKFPFDSVSDPTSVEIFHGAHGNFETRSPVRTFTTITIDNQPHLLAAYTCTPLVQFPIDEIKPGAKVRGKTIAELGNRNRPIDMFVYQKDGKDYILMANSSRGVMKIATEGMAAAASITEPVREEKAGVGYETIAAWTNIQQLDKDGQYAVVVRGGAEGSIDLDSLPLP